MDAEKPAHLVTCTLWLEPAVPFLGVTLGEWEVRATQNAAHGWLAQPGSSSLKLGNSPEVPPRLGRRTH